MKLSASSMGFKAVARRQFATQSLIRPSSSVLANQKALTQAFKRAYSDIAPAKKPRRFRYFRWIWRATYLSALAGIGYVAYDTWDQQSPPEQFIPDPSKKNLVILGM